MFWPFDTNRASRSPCDRMAATKRGRVLRRLWHCTRHCGRLSTHTMTPATFLCAPFLTLIQALPAAVVPGSATSCGGGRVGRTSRVTALPLSVPLGVGSKARQVPRGKHILALRLAYSQAGRNGGNLRPGRRLAGTAVYHLLARDGLLAGCHAVACAVKRCALNLYVAGRTMGYYAENGILSRRILSPLHTVRVPSRHQLFVACLPGAVPRLFDSSG